jgi:hypothetical protein
VLENVMSNKEFHARATAWLRDARHVELAPRSPADAQRPSAEIPRRTGEMTVETAAGKWGYTGFVLSTAAAILALVASRPGLGAVVQTVIVWAAWAGLVGGFVLLVAAWRVRAPPRPVCVYLVAGAKAQSEAVARANADEFPGEIWVIADSQWSQAALTAAAEGRAICFEARGAGFVQAMND